MGIIKTKGIVIAQNNMGDNDKMVTILTPDLGKIGCSARGARRPKSALMSGTQYLCFANFIIYKGISSYNINSCEPIEIFYNIRLDIDKLNYASKVTKIAKDVTNENQNSYNVLQLVLNTIYMISESEKDLEFILSVFKIRLLSQIGYRPIVEHCCNCNNKEKLTYFSFKDNGLKCDNCGKIDKGAIKISETTEKAIKYIIWAEPKKIFSFDMAVGNQKELNMIAKIYLNNCLEKDYK